MNKTQSEHWKIVYLEVLKCLCTNSSISFNTLFSDANPVARALANQAIKDFIDIDKKSIKEKSSG